MNQTPEHTLDGVAMPPAPPRNKTARPPFFLLITAGVLAVLGVVLIIPINNLPERTKSDNVLLTGVPFILIFVGIVFAFVFVIWLIASRLNNRISQRAYNTVELAIVGGVALGLLGMFQAWNIAGYQIGFHLLLASFIAFNIWSHVTPKRVRRGEE